MKSEDPAEIVLGRSTDWDDLTQRLIGLFDQPAYMRRALRVEDAIRGLEQRLFKQREQQLEFVRRPLRIWRALSQRDPAIAERLNENNRQVLDTLLTTVLTDNRPLAGSLWLPRPRKVLTEIHHAVERFNERWGQLLDVVDVSPINQRIDEYNEHYLLEKECAFRSPRAAARGFQPLAHVDRHWLKSLHPPLPNIEL